MAEEIDEIFPEENPEAAPSAADQTTPEGSEAVKTPAEDSVPYARFKEVIEEKNSFKAELGQMREEIESLKAKEPEPEPTTFQEVEDRAIKKALTQFEKRQAESQEKEREQEQAIENKFEQLKQIGQDITPELRKAVLTEMVRTGNDDVVATFLEVKKSLDKSSKSETLKKEGFIPPSHKGSPAPSGYNYKEIQSKTLDQIIDEAE